jgi:two-component system, OmpR family, sensor kinase
MPLRVRLAAWNAIVIIGVMLLLGGFTYALEERSLSDEIDESLRNQARNLAGVYQVRASLPPRARERVIPQPSVFSAPSFHIQLVDPEGQVVERSSGLGNRRLPINSSTLERAGNGDEVFETVTVDGQNVRLFTVAVIANDEFVGYLEVARSLELLDDALEFLARTLLVAGASLLAIALAVAWILSGVSLRPIGRVTQAAQEVARSGRLDERLEPVKTRDEVARLADTFNHMLERLETAFSAQRRFVADASHELRTPLTTILGNLQLIKRTGAVQEPEMAEALDDVISEAERMSRLVHGLLALARADAGQGLEKQTVSLDAIVHAVHREAQAMDHGRIVQLGSVDPLEVLGNADALKQLLWILVDNGMKYTPPEGSVVLSLEAQGDQGILIVTDTGTGIAPEDLPHVFDRFYRSSTSRASGGTGLGLAIAHWVADEHGAEIAVSSAPGVGTTFRIRFPATVRTTLTRPRPERELAIPA